MPYLIWAQTVNPSSLAPFNSRSRTASLVDEFAHESCTNRFVASSKPSSEHDFDVSTYGKKIVMLKYQQNILRKKKKLSFILFIYLA